MKIKRDLGITEYYKSYRDHMTSVVHAQICPAHTPSVSFFSAIADKVASFFVTSDHVVKAKLEAEWLQWATAL